jgi:hypothetical protein
MARSDDWCQNASHVVARGRTSFKGNAMMKSAAKLVIAAVALCAAVHAFGQTIRVGSVTDTRFQTSWTLNGSQMANTRAKLLNAANFGPGGTVTSSVLITDTAAAVGSVTTALLSNFDVFFIGYLLDTSPNAFTPAEIAAMQAYVNSGGTMIVTCDDNDYDAVCAAFGHPATTGSPGINPIVPTAAGSANAIFNGPFGVVTSINETGTRGAFTNTTGSTVLAVDSTPVTPLPVVLTQNFGLGRVIFLADVDLIANSLSGGATITTQNDRFLGNLFASVPPFAAAPTAPLAPVPTLSEYALVLLVLLVATFGWRLRRRGR